MKRLTRRELSGYVASELVAGNNEVVEQLAAYLVASHRVREAKLVVRDIESALCDRGVVVAHVATAHDLQTASKEVLKKLLESTFNATALYMQETVEADLLGGVKVAAANKELDSTVRRTLNQLKSVKV